VGCQGYGESRSFYEGKLVLALIANFKCWEFVHSQVKHNLTSSPLTLQKDYIEIIISIPDSLYIYIKTLSCWNTFSPCRQSMIFSLLIESRTIHISFEDRPFWIVRFLTISSNLNEIRYCTYTWNWTWSDRHKSPWKRSCQQARKSSMIQHCYLMNTTKANNLTRDLFEGEWTPIF